MTKDIAKLENVQKLALKVCLNGWNLSYDQLVDRANLPTLQIEGNTLNYVPFINCFMAYITFHLMFYCLVPAEELTILVSLYHLPALQLTSNSSVEQPCLRGTFVILLILFKSSY